MIVQPCGLFHSGQVSRLCPLFLPRQSSFCVLSSYVTPGVHADNVAFSRWIVTLALAIC